MGITTTRRPTVRISGLKWDERSDTIAVESPLTLLLDGEVVVTTMRTPGHDLELAAGWLVNESGVRESKDIIGMGAFANAEPTNDGSDPKSRDNASVDTVRLYLRAGIDPPRPRAFVTTSSCGVCSADVLAAFTGPTAPLHTPGWRLPIDRVHPLLERMREEQRMFDQTGSLHAACLADPALEPLWVREDVGRHNAVDKVIGRALFEDRLPLTDHFLVVSGRVSYEIVHKALTASIAGIIAVSGPTSLAVDLARTHGLILIGFARDDRMNVYSGAELVERRRSGGARDLR
jgi:FdhD protein